MTLNLCSQNVKCFLSVAQRSPDDQELKFEHRVPNSARSTAPSGVSVETKYNTAAKVFARDLHRILLILLSKAKLTFVPKVLNVIRVEKATRAIDVDPPQTRPHVAFNAKGLQLEREKQDRIARENFILLRKLRDIMQRERPAEKSYRLKLDEARCIRTR
ncbi:hypothetical protein E2986_14003 [Frieseomelitta varia]|uniref:Uncharacterized protein n=1 Tax=Frieseomelitta varia TaxID=561572 RepID=A0A833SM10_9HYME|nr:hypothetical protein E2986_14003 [Frieseomelitta varia]